MIRAYAGDLDRDWPEDLITFKIRREENRFGFYSLVNKIWIVWLNNFYDKTFIFRVKIYVISETGNIYDTCLMSETWEYETFEISLHIKYAYLRFVYFTATKNEAKKTYIFNFYEIEII